MSDVVPKAEAPAPRLGRPRATSAACLQRAALERFAQRGYSATSVEDIAAELGIGRTTIFRYFGSKSGLVWQDFDGTADELMAQLERQPRELPPLEALAAGLEAHFEPTDEARELLRLRLDIITASPELETERAQRAARLAGTVADFLRSRASFETNPVLPEAFGYALASVMSSVVRRWAVAPEGSSYREMLRQSLAGIVPPFAHMMEAELEAGSPPEQR